MKACTVEQMHNIDKTAESLGGIPSIVLMENAAISCVKHLGDVKGKKIAVFCGKGNNGGDGLAIARHLTMMGANADTFLLFSNDFSNDALINYEILSKMGVNISEITKTDNLKYLIGSYDIVVDAIFGTGIHGEITGIAQEVIEAINSYAKFVLSVDIPSGVSGDDGSICSVAVKADITVTFFAYKIGMTQFPGADYLGKVFVENISIPNYLAEHININITDDELVNKIMPKRYNDSHKGNYGKLLIIGGSRGLTGAAAMAAEAALKCGVGLITVAVPKSLNGIFEVKLTEQMTAPLPDFEGSITKNAIDTIKQYAENADAILFGPGIGRSPEIVDVLRELLRVSRVPVIVDADGLYAISKDMDMLSECGCNLIFTPHEAEFARISGLDAEQIHSNRLEISAKFAEEYGITLILKGARTVVTSPDGMQFINICGNNGMATGGSGDVLAGMVAAFTARGVGECDAAVLATYFHSAAADKAAESVGKNALTPTDIINTIPLILPVE